jgi:hypothetical protein
MFESSSNISPEVKIFSGLKGSPDPGYQPLGNGSEQSERKKNNPWCDSNSVLIVYGMNPMKYQDNGINYRHSTRNCNN